MTLGQEQEAFAAHVPLLILKAIEMGLTVRIGEVQRTADQQAIYFKQGKSKTMDSMHLKKCAIDLNLFVDGNWATLEDIRPLGRYWESLDPKNRWGGSWRGKVERKESTFIDAPHFERYV